MLEKRSDSFINEMVGRGVTAAVARVAADAGYVVWPIASGGADAPKLMVMDCHYGLKQSALFTLDEFAAYLKGESTPERAPSGVETYYDVRDIQDVREIASLPRHQKYISEELTSFRGQTVDYRLCRTVRNPRISDEEGKERIITPSYWRRYLDAPFSERDWGPNGSIFGTMLADPLVYHGLPDWQTLGERNFQRYGFHSLSDLEDFPDPESQEYFKRWKLHKIAGLHEYPLIEQHYGNHTIGLDITFDLATAAFFASHQWTPLDDRVTATYKPVPMGQHTGVIYFLTFISPRVRKTEHLVKQLGVYDHLPVVRPVRQQCGLPGFHANEIAAAARDLDAILHLSKNFDPSGLPEPAFLFPISEDPFYLQLL